MKKLLTLATVMSCIAFPSVAAEWKGEIFDGVLEAKVEQSSNTHIILYCDVGINAPITAINVSIAGTTPSPNSTIRFAFDNDTPIFATADSEGGIASLEQTQEEIFSMLLNKLREKSQVSVRIYDGSEETFALMGSSDAIGDCTADYWRYQVANNS